MANTTLSQHKILLLTITMMSVIGLVASDIFLPALPSIVENFHISANQGQSILGSFLFGIAVMQPLYGPVSDSFGRRKLLLLGIGLFSITSLAIPHATDLHQVLALRVLQAIGACSGITLGRAIVSDLFSKEEASKVFLTIFPVVGMSPAIAPLVGGQLNNLWGWQACFLFSMCFGIFLIFLILLGLPETLPPQRRLPLSFRQVVWAYRTLLANCRFWHYAIIPCIAYSVYFAYIAESPFLLQEQGLSPSGRLFVHESLRYLRRRKSASPPPDAARPRQRSIAASGVQDFRQWRNLPSACHPPGTSLLPCLHCRRFRFDLGQWLSAAFGHERCRHLHTGLGRFSLWSDGCIADRVSGTSSRIHWPTFSASTR
jgi:DHA1 family bicyclomycin/chloramphenicol resistance-like MFS transporter